MHPKPLTQPLFPIALLVTFLLCPQIVKACGCYFATTSALEEFDNSDIVVIARFVSTDKFDEPNPRYVKNIRAFTMEVEKVFKGNVSIGKRITFQQGNGIDCLWSLFDEDIGSKFLFYLGQPQKPEEPWAIFGCGRSKPIENASDDLLLLNNLDKARGRTRVSGTVEFDGDAADGIKIRIRGQKKTYVAVTDKNGVYELYDLPPGRYVLELELRGGWKVEGYHLTREPTRSELMNPKPPSNRVAFTLRPKKHFGVDLSLVLSNHISGTVNDEFGRPMPWVCVSFAPVDHKHDLACNSLTDKLGRFRIDSVEAGKYVLTFNPEDKRTVEMPFSKLYYNNVREHEKATILTIDHGQSIDGLKLVVPISDQVITVKGTVVYADGRPAAERSIIF